MHPDNDLPAMSSCTTCRFVEDKSNYWTAVMYFKHPNGSFIRVGIPPIPGLSLDAPTRARYLKWQTITPDLDSRTEE